MFSTNSINSLHLRSRAAPSRYQSNTSLMLRLSRPSTSSNTSNAFVCHRQHDLNSAHARAPAYLVSHHSQNIQKTCVVEDDDLCLGDSVIVCIHPCLSCQGSFNDRSDSFSTFVVVA